MRSIPASDAAPGEEYPLRPGVAPIESAPLVAGEAPALPETPLPVPAPGENTQTLASGWDTEADTAQPPTPPDRDTQVVPARRALWLGAAAFIVGGVGEALLFPEATRLWGALVLAFA